MAIPGTYLPRSARQTTRPVRRSRAYVFFSRVEANTRFPTTSSEPRIRPGTKVSHRFAPLSARRARMPPSNAATYTKPSATAGVA